MTEQLNAKLGQAKGAVKEGLGKLTDDKALQAEGAVEKAAGKAKEVAADIKDTVTGAIDSLKKN